VTESKKEASRVQPGSGILSDYTSNLTLQGLRNRLPDLTAQLIFWPVVATGTALDLWSKSAVFDWLRHRQGDSVAVIDGFFQFVLAENAGVAFGLAAGHRYFLVTVSIIALIVVICFFLLGGSKTRLVHIALGLFAAGVCGNLYDRIFNCGYVRDFIDVVYWPGKHWPAFNIADSMLCVGVGLIIISSLRASKHPA
jgi:signal peptidase II